MGKLKLYILGLFFLATLRTTYHTSTDKRTARFSSFNYFI